MRSTWIRLWGPLLLAPLALALGPVGCGGEEAPAPAPVAPVAPKAKAKAKAPVEEAPEEVAPVDDDEGDVEKDESPFGQARTLIASRQLDEGIDALHALLDGSPDDARVWVLMRITASENGRAKAVLAKLGDQPPSGAAGHFHETRALLQLAAGDAEAAMLSARQLSEADAELGAVYTVRALAAGAKLPEELELDIEDANDALILAFQGEEGALEKTAPQTWKGLAARSEIHAKLKNTSSRQADLDAAFDKADDEGIYDVAQRLAEIETSPGLAAKRLDRAARAANNLGLAASTVRLTQGAMDGYLKIGRTTDAMTLVSQVLPARAVDGDHLGAATLGINRAEAGMATGRVSVALAAAKQAGEEATAGELNELATEAALAEGAAAWLLGQEEPLREAAERAGQHAAVLQGLVSILEGDAESGLRALGKSKVAGEIGVRVQLAGARAAHATDTDARPYTDRAVKLADSSGQLILKVETRLEKERFQRDQGHSTKEVLADLSTLAESLGNRGEPLIHEISARRAMAGTSGDYPASAEWADLVAGKAPADVNSPMAEFSLARAKARSGDFDAAYTAWHSAYGETVSHHRGPWAPISVLPGRAGPGVGGDMAALAGSNAREAALAGLIVHDWAHAGRAIDEAFAVGDDPSLALTSTERAAYYEAHLALRAATTAWLVGEGDSPAEAQAAVDKVDEAAMDNPGFANSLAPALPDYKARTEDMESGAIISYRLGAGGGEVIALAPAKAVIHPLRQEAIAALSAEVGSSIFKGKAMGGRSVSPTVGDKLRRVILDPLEDTLSGQGRYLVIPDGPLWEVPLGALPEQADGQRYLGDIRTVSVARSVAEAWRQPALLPEAYTPDYLGVSRLGVRDATTEDGELLATEAENIGRHFPDSKKKVLNGKSVKSKAVLEQIPTARFVHLADVKAGTRGTIYLREDQTITLAELRKLDLKGVVVTISGDASNAVSRRWAQALRSAGVRSVLVVPSSLPLAERSRYLHAFYSNVILSENPAQSLQDTRNSLIRDPARRDPSWWGSYTLHSTL